MAKILPDDSGVHYDNTTESVGPTASSILPPDTEHVIRVLDEHDPEFVLSCGKQAGEVAQVYWSGRLLCIPHPTWRLFSNRLAVKIREIIEADVFGRLIVTSTDRDTIIVKDIEAATERVLR